MRQVSSPDSLLGEFPSYANMFVELLGKKQRDFDFVTYDARLDVFPHCAQECDAWVLRLCDLIQDIDQMQRPLVGICFGHQVIAQALGGRVEKYQGGWGVGVHHCS